jgi:putative aldouronate transport system permease protein
MIKRKKWNTEDLVFDAINISLLVIVSLVTLFPLYYVTIVSFTDPTEFLEKTYVLWPSDWSIVSYQYILSTDSFVRGIGVSGFLATVGTICSLVVTSGIAYTLSRKRFAARRVILLAILFTILFQPGMIPQYLVVRDLGLIDSIWALIIPSLTGGWYVILMKGFFDSIPESLEEAAAIDGCNDMTAWWRVILPLSLPAMAAFGLFYAVAYWNTFFNAVLYINNYELWPIQIILRNMLVDSSTSLGGDAAAELAANQYIPTETLKMAAVVIATVPILAVYPFLQKHFAKGAMVGSIKG